MSSSPVAVVTLTGSRACPEPAEGACPESVEEACPELAEGRADNQFSFGEGGVTQKGRVGGPDEVRNNNTHRAHTEHLWVGVQQQYTTAHLHQGSAQVDGRRGLPDASLLAGECYDAHPYLLHLCWAYNAWKGGIGSEREWRHR